MFYFLQIGSELKFHNCKVLTGIWYMDNKIRDFSIFETMLVSFIYLRLNYWPAKIYYTAIHQFPKLMIKFIRKRSLQIFLFCEMLSKSIWSNPRIVYL